VKILHLTQYCHAGSIGGTERYLLDLIRALKPHGVESSIGWLWADPRKSFESQGIPVHPLPPALMRVDEPPAELAPVAQALLESERPDFVHFHTFGLAEASIARLAIQRGIPYAFTYHSPGWTCRREDLLIWGGQQPCDGEVRTLRCAACKVQERLGGPALGGYLGALSSAPLDWMFSRSSNVNFRRRVCFLSDTRRYRRGLREFLGNCSLVVSCSEWGRPVLIVNGAPPDRVIMVPQGVPRDFIDAARQAATQSLPRRPGTPFTVGYIGRVTGVKGADILARGFSRVQGKDARLQIYGFVENERTVRRLNATLAALARRDSRIHLRPKLPFVEVVHAYAELDLVCIPSVWCETGPLVLFEALQMDIPVFGSNRVGHLGLLREGGMIVEPNTPDGWQAALTSALDEFRKGQWAKRREHIRTRLNLRSMDDVAAEMVAHYQAVTEERHTISLAKT
jgi:glycosyltransferase involved in cell wall biosynthesis